MSDYDPFAETHNTEGVNENSVHDRGGRVEKAGWYHVQVTSVEYVAAVLFGEEGGPRLPRVDLILRVLAGTEKSEVDKIIFHRLRLASWEDQSQGLMCKLEPLHLNSLLAWFHAFGTVGSEVFGQAAVKLDRGMYERLEDTVAVVKVWEDTNEKQARNSKGELYETKWVIQYNNHAYPVGHKKVANVPLSPDFADVNPAADSGGDDDFGGI